MRWAVLFVVATLAALLTKYAFLASAGFWALSILDGIYLSLTVPTGPRRWDQALGFLGSYVAIGFVLNQYVLQMYRVPSSSMTPTLPLGTHIMAEKITYRVKAPAAGDVAVFRHPCSDRDFVMRVVATAGQTVEVRCGVLYIDGAAQAQDGAHPAKIHDETGDGQPVELDVTVKTEHLGSVAHDISQRPGNPAAHDFPRVDLEKAPSCVTPALDQSGVPTAALGQEPGTLSVATAGAAECAPQRHYTVPKGHVFVLGDSRDNANDSRNWGSVPLSYVEGRVIWQHHW
jgi:signal peptidase I